MCKRVIKVVILDDEYLVIEAMETLIRWDKLNMQVVGTAMDGKSGFDLIVDKEPDIVLTDIRMPVIDGLSIIEKAKYIYPNMQFILFSGYTDFDYARKAIVLGVIDYIVKPITAQKVEDALEKALMKIDTKDASQIRQEIQKKLLDGIQISEENWEQTEVSMGIEEIRECIIIVCSVPENNLVVKEYLESTMVFKKYGVLYRAYPNMQVIICLSSGSNSKDKMLESLQSVIQIWKKGEESCFIGYSYGKIVQTGIPNVYNQAKEAMSYGMFIGSSQIIDYQMIQVKKRLPHNILRYQIKMLNSVRENQTDQIESYIQEFMGECKELHTEPNLVKHFILEFVYSALSLERKSEQKDFPYYHDTQINDAYDCPPYIYVNKCSNYNELTQWFMMELKRIAMSLEEGKSGVKNRSQIREVREYIHTYYQKDLTLFMLSEIAKMTPSYFSNVFKQEVGTSYIKYLTKVRMEKAKELLTYGYKIGDVSKMVGYENYRYFSVVFKKYTGVKAQQFKKRTEICEK